MEEKMWRFCPWCGKSMSFHDGDPTMTCGIERDGDDRSADELTAARAHPHCPECRLVLEDCRCQP